MALDPCTPRAHSRRHKSAATSPLSLPSAAQPGAVLLRCLVSRSEAGDVFSRTGFSVIPLSLKRVGAGVKEGGKPQGRPIGADLR